MKTRRYFYTFQYADGKVVLSGTNGLWFKNHEIDHTVTCVGDVYNVEAFDLQGSYPMPATIIGKVSFDWDMSEPIGKRQSGLFIDGVGYAGYKK